MRQGMPIPKRIQNAPVLLMGLEVFLVGFLDLTGSRQLGMGGSGPIPWAAVREYCLLTDLDEDQMDDMHYHIGRLDAVWQNYQAQKEKKSSG